MGCTFNKAELIHSKTSHLPTNMFIRTKEGYSIPLKFYNREKDYTILYCHGATEDYKSACHWIENNLIPLDLVNVLVFDYCASQELNDNVNESCIYIDCEAVLWFITDCLRLTKRKIILFGKCIGAGVALYLAERYPDMAGLVMMSCLTYSLRTSYKFKISFPRDFYPSPELVKKIQCPLMFIHGAQDQVTNFRYVKDFYESARNSNKKLVGVEGGHELEGNEVLNGIKEFLEKMHI